MRPHSARPTQMARMVNRKSVNQVSSLSTQPPMATHLRLTNSVRDLTLDPQFLNRHGTTSRRNTPHPSDKRNRGLLTQTDQVVLIGGWLATPFSSPARKCSPMGVPANFSPSRRDKSSSELSGR